MHMPAPGILTNVAVLLVIGAAWQDMKGAGRLTPGRRTWFMVAAILAVVSAVLHFV